MDSKSGDVVCSIKLPATGITHLGFGRCPQANDGKLNCLYITTARNNINQPTVYDGAVLLIEGLLSEGCPFYRVDPSQITGKGCRSYTWK